MKVFDYDETLALLPYPELARSIAVTLALRRSGKALAPERIHLPLPGGGVLLVMPARDHEYAVTKMVTVHPDNPSQGLDAIRGEMVVMDARDGTRLGILDGRAVTARRTAALSLLAAMHLAPVKEGPMLLIGAGAQARAHLEAFHYGLDVDQVFIASRSGNSAAKLAVYANEFDVDAEKVDDPAEVIADCPLVVSATSSENPVVPPDVRDDAFIAAVGAFRAQISEVPSELVARCSLFVDTMEGARSEAGDLIQAGVDWEQVTALADVLSWETPPRGPVLFKSVGHALFDLAAARLAFGARMT